MKVERDLRPGRALGVALLIAFAPSAPAGQAEGEAAAALSRTFDGEIRPFLTTYCLGCHGPPKPKAEFDLSIFTNGPAALKRRDVWKDGASRVQAHDMPPVKEKKQPTPAERARFIAWVESFKTLAPKDPGPGPLRRLSQVEYANSLADLLEVDPKVAAEVPQDTVGEGFNSSISPLHMEKYLAAAEDALDLAVKAEQLKARWAGPQISVIADGKKAAPSPSIRITGPGEASVTFQASTEGVYTIRVKAAAERVVGGKEPCRLAVRLNGESIGEIKVSAVPPSPGTYTLSCKLSPGSVVLSIAMANPYAEPPPAKPAPKGAPPAAEKPVARTLLLDAIEVQGPPAEMQTLVQKKLFIAFPSDKLPPRDAARKILEPFARKAFRRPPQPPEIEGHLKVFDLADGKGAGFTESVRLMLKSVLVSPAFLLLGTDEPPAGAPPGAVVPLGPHALAARLSYLFWSSPPDAELSALADAGSLKDPAVVAAQAKRLLADPRSRALFDGFGAAWLGVDRILDHDVDETKFPQLTPALRRSMYEEAALLFDAILRGHRSLLDFVTADFTFLNGPLAKHYGMESAAQGPRMVRVALSDPNRGGVMTLPGVLTVTSLPNRTSPVKRGRWVLEQILGQSPPPPPADVPALEKQDSPSLNLRQRMEKHRQNPACFGCHQTIDPLGFGLENFDVLGRWRTKDDTGSAVDAKGELPDGAVFASPAELKKIVAARKDELCRNLVKRILGYVLCRAPQGYDEVVADEIAAQIAREGYGFHDIWIKVVTSFPFLNRRIGR
jgi:hypothetical protein